MPISVLFQECVCEDDEFSHEGGDGLFWRFSCGDELVIFDFHIGVEAHGDEGWHVKRLAHLFAPTMDEGFALPLTRLAGDGCEAGKGCGLFFVKAAEFGHLGDQHGRSEGRDSGDRDQDRKAGGQGWIRVDQSPDRLVEGVQLLVDLLAARLVLAFEQGQMDGFGAVPGGGSVFDKGLTSEVQVLEIIEARARHGPRRQAQQCAHAGEHCGIERVGLGKLADCLSEAFGLTGIDLDDGHPGRRELDLELAMVRPRGLVNDPRRHRPDPPDQRFMAGRRVVKTFFFIAGKAMCIEMVFRNVDSNGNFNHLLPLPLLVIRGQSPGIRSGLWEKTRAILL